MIPTFDPPFGRLDAIGERQIIVDGELDARVTDVDVYGLSDVVLDDDSVPRQA
ncbi:hypothetical protein [Halorussus sp. MSC15.2]|uniref:hypothetical protein n=1 Tax=Halorussus sp. MSC15.2 TaxID=2283638 RepID=UPI0013D629B8|nr:hypothetical protein [Halorussus sp. MSC15.2]NEU56297.1 hypothetical protein [Halorussus sp. MSC15.2]